MAEAAGVIDGADGAPGGTDEGSMSQYKAGRGGVVSRWAVQATGLPPNRSRPVAPSKYWQRDDRAQAGHVGHVKCVRHVFSVLVLVV